MLYVIQVAPLYGDLLYHDLIYINAVTKAEVKWEFDVMNTLHT